MTHRPVLETAKVNKFPGLPRPSRVTGVVRRLAGQFPVAAIALATLWIAWVHVVPPLNQVSVGAYAAAFAGSAILGWLIGRGHRVPGAVSAAAPERFAGLAVSTSSTVASESQRLQVLKSALDNLSNLKALDRSPLTLLLTLSPTPATGAQLKRLLVDVITELATSGVPRDGEAGRLLLNYYVKRVGSHEVVMERLCLSRPTFYRRLQRGLELVADRLETGLDASSQSQEGVAS